MKCALFISAIAGVLFIFWFVRFVRNTKLNIKRIWDAFDNMQAIERQINQHRKPKYNVGDTISFQFIESGLGFECNFVIKEGIVVGVTPVYDKSVISDYACQVFDKDKNETTQFYESTIFNNSLK